MIKSAFPILAIAIGLIVGAVGMMHLEGTPTWLAYLLGVTAGYFSGKV